MNATPYSEDFFHGIDAGSRNSARVILQRLQTVFHPRSVFDLGCGHGAWLGVAGQLGATTLRGVDGPWVKPEMLASKTIIFEAVDMERPIAPRVKADLSLCLEVGEHLGAERASAIVETLCATSDVVIFSAAIPGQGGTNHINEQWQSHWARLFAAQGFNCFDFFRPHVWSDEQVQPWYRQNVLLYVKEAHPLSAEFRRHSPATAILDVVHPRIYEGNMENLSRAQQSPTLRLCLQLLGRWARRKFGSG